jgi:hypothetical protein
MPLPSRTRYRHPANPPVTDEDLEDGSDIEEEVKQIGPVFLMVTIPISIMSATFKSWGAHSGITFKTTSTLDHCFQEAIADEMLFSDTNVIFGGDLACKTGIPQGDAYGIWEQNSRYATFVGNATSRASDTYLKPGDGQ